MWNTTQAVVTQDLWKPEMGEMGVVAWALRAISCRLEWSQLWGCLLEEAQDCLIAKVLAKAEEGEVELVVVAMVTVETATPQGKQQ